MYNAKNLTECIDGTHTNSWLAASGDPDPWVQFRLERGVSARTLKFAAASPYVGDPKSWDRPG